MARQDTHDMDMLHPDHDCPRCRDEADQLRPDYGHPRWPGQAPTRNGDAGHWERW